MMVPSASAHLGTPVSSSWTTNPPTIDGVISGGEWADATVVPFTFEMRGTLGGLGDTLDAIFYVKNDGSNIYTAVQVLNEEYSALDFGLQWDGLALLFDDNHNGNLEDGENGEGATTYNASVNPSPFYTHHDLSIYSMSWDTDINWGGNEDGAMAWTHTAMIEGVSGTYTFEMQIPLTTVPDGDAYDLYITVLPKTVGFKLWFIDKATHGVYPDNATHTKNHEETELGGTFGDLVLAAPPPPAVGGMAAPIAIPINEPNLLTPLIWLASAIIFPIALTIVFAKLKKKKL